jgi:hypothetical protein
MANKELQKKIRRLFVNRTHRGIKITVHVDKEAQKYRTLIAPYEPTVEKLAVFMEKDRAEQVRKMFPEYDRVDNPGYTFMINKDELDALLKGDEAK